MTRRTPMQPARTLLGFGFALFIGLSGLVGGTPDAPTAPTACSTTGSQDLPASITTHLILDCKTLRAMGDVTVGNGGHLDLGNDTLTVQGPKVLRVQSGGRLTLYSTVMQSRDPAAHTEAFQVVAEAGSTVSLRQVRIEGLGNLTIRTLTFTAADLRIESFHGAAVFVTGGKIDATRVAVHGGPSALVLRAGAVATMRHVSLSALSVSGLDAQASTATIREIAMTGVASPLVTAGASVLRIENLTLASQEASLGPSGPLLELYDPVPTWSPAHFTFADASGTVRLGSQPRVQVLDQGTNVPVPGVLVELRRTPGEAPLQTRSTGTDGVTPYFRFVHTTVNKTATTTLPADPVLFLKKLHNVGTGSFPLAALGPGVVHDVPLSQTEDHDPPAWSDPPTSRLAALPWNGTGAADLAWGVVTDPGGSTHAVSHFLLYRFPSDANQPPNVTLVYGQNRIEPLYGAGPVGFRVGPVDLAGNEGELSNLVTVRRDPDRPDLKVVRKGLAGPDPTWFRSASAILRVEAIDNLSGLYSLHEVTPQLIGCGDTTTAAFLEQTFTTEGLRTLAYRACDQARNARDVKAAIGIDRAPPDVFTFRFVPPRPDGAAGWYTKPVALIVDASDQLSGLGAMSYRLKAADPWVPFATNTTITASGAHLLSLNVTDKAGNSRFAQARLSIDSVPPTLATTWQGEEGANGWYRGPVEVSLVANDTHSGIDAVGYHTATQAATRTDTIVRFDREQNTTVRFYALDQAGNTLETPWRDLRIDLERPVPPLIVVVPPTTTVADYRLGWSAAPPADALSGIPTIEIHRSTDGKTFERIGTVPGTALEARLTLVPGKTNHLFVRAVDRAGWTSDSNVVRIAGQGIVGTGQSTAEEPLRIRGEYTFISQPPDPGNVTSVTFYLDGVLVSARADPPFEWNVNAAELASGAHESRVVVARVDGSTREETFPFVVRSGYGAYVEDHAVLLAPLGLVGLAGLGAGAWGLRRLHGQEGRPE